MTSTRTIRVEHNGKIYSGHIAKIDSTTLGYEAHGILTAYLNLSWGSSGIAIGGYSLDTPKEGRRDFARVGTAYGLDHLIRIMETVGVEKWEALKGQQVIVLFEGDNDNTWGMKAAGIAGMLNDRVFILSEHAEAWRSEMAGA